ncbi:MAG: PQ-loop repeat-containing protein [Bacteroidales bacterium]|nr:PQ-loop repeat-containing protein [Bacteroidales bacterium]
MEQEMFCNLFGLMASICMVLGYLPQAIHTIRTRDTDGIALPTFLMMGIGSVFFVIQAFIHKPDIIWSLLITSLVTAICSCIVLCIKIHNDYYKK